MNKLSLNLPGGVMDMTYGFNGSLKVSRKSSILLVCSLIASRGLGSVAMFLEDPPN